MNHKQYMQSVKEYRQRSGHAINYYEGGYSVPGEPYMNKKVQKGSLAKEKMRDLLAKSDSKSNRSSKRKSTVGEESDF